MNDKFEELFKAMHQFHKLRIGEMMPNVSGADFWAMNNIVNKSEDGKITISELAKKTKDKTVIIVAQRINTILNADQIIVLEDGKIVGKGTHEELIKNNETYKQIALSQLSEEELNLQKNQEIEGGNKHE